MAAEPTKATAAPGRRWGFRWLRFSLRGLLLLVTVLGVWLGIKVDQARRQKRAVETLRALGAEIAYEHQRVKGGFDTTIELDVPTWARQLCGDDFFQTVAGVYFWPKLSEDHTGTLPHALTDDDLVCLADLPHLERLFIDNAPITDAGLAHLKHPKQLTEIQLDKTGVGDGFVRRLKGSNRLKVLGLSDTKVTDEGLAELNGITTLTSLELLGTQTGDPALAAFRHCNLRILRLGDKATDECLRQFETLEDIEFLTAEGARITGEAFRGIKLPTVDDVHLRNCAVGDNDLPQLVEALQDIRVLVLIGCSVSDEGLKHLKNLGKTQILLLNDSKIQGRELGQLASLSGIQWLSLRGCPLENPDLKSLEPLYTGTAPGMNLSLDKTPIGDADLAKISGFTNLTHLSLDETKITDAALPHLYALKKLAVLDLGGTRVTAKGVAQLKKAIPRILVAWDGDPRPTGWPW